MSRADADLFDLEALLANAGWLRRLARHLASRPDDAEDLVQETWVAALRSPPDPARPVRPWLAEVARNLGRMTRRSASRRPVVVGGEDDLAGVRDSAGATDDVLEQLQLQRRLVALVSELEEPYRTAILLRFYEGMTTPAIADRLGIAAGTLRWRLSEGVRRLRARLDAGERERPGRWRALALLPVGAARPRRAGTQAWLWPGALVGAVACTWVSLHAVPPVPAAVARARTSDRTEPVAIVAAAPTAPHSLGANPIRLTTLARVALPALAAAADDDRPYTRDEMIDDCLEHRRRLTECREVAANDALRGWKQRWGEEDDATGPTAAEIAHFRQERLADLAKLASIPVELRRQRCAEAVDAGIARGDVLPPRSIDRRWHACAADPDCERASRCALAVRRSWSDRPVRSGF